MPVPIGVPIRVALRVPFGGLGFRVEGLFPLRAPLNGCCRVL